EQAAAELKAGRNPFANQKGTFLRGYYSEIDGSVQGYALFVPEKYDGQQPFPLVVNLHGYDPSFSSWQENIFLPIFMPHTTKGGRYIVVNPFGRGNTMYQNLGEQDVLEVIAEVRRLYKIDANRIYLTGGSMGGGGTWHLGLTHSDMFAAIAPIMGPTEFAFWTGFPYESASPPQKFFAEQRSPLFYAENALNLPIFCHHGVLDDIVPIDQSRKIVAKLKKLGYDVRYVEHPNAAHGGFDPSMEESIYDWFENLRRNPRPEKIVLKCGDLNHASSYWVEILRFIDILQFAKIEASAKNSLIRIETENVAQFKLKLKSCPVDKSENLVIQIDGDEFEIASNQTFEEINFRKITNKSDEKFSWEIFSKNNEGKLIKKKGLTGPILDVFNSGFVLVYGTRGSEQENMANFAAAINFQNQWRKWQHVSPRIKADYAITQTDIENSNLILLGSPEENLLTKKIIPHLPVQFEDDAIHFGDKIFHGKDVGIAMIYPNPLNPEHYVVIYGGNSWRAIVNYAKDIGMDFDYQIFDSRTLGIHILQGNLTVEGTPLLCGYFNQDWKIDEKYQWRANENLRKTIKPRKIQITRPKNTDKEIYLTDIEIDSSNYWTGGYEFNRSIWGEPFKLKAKIFEKGLGLFPPISLIYKPIEGSEPSKDYKLSPKKSLVYKTNGEFETFSAIFTVVKNPFWKKEKLTSGKMQLAIYGDGEELYVSPAIDVNSEPVPIEVDIASVKEFVLKVRTQDWLPKFEQAANLIDAKFIREKGDK
ncbi:MAG: prolyl oligopeptidase family serine peptidase, partial [Calditrichaeota bacterium]|nr:prolyl oligopeptidase family serine peptidase [Calditrichota bacterium]